MADGVDPAPSDLAQGRSRWHICGIPSTFYTDNGSDFTSHHIEQVAADLKIELIFSLPSVPRGRGKIERFFSTGKQMLLPELPGYAPEGGGEVEPQPKPLSQNNATTPLERWSSNVLCLSYPTLPKIADAQRG